LQCKALIANVVEGILVLPKLILPASWEALRVSFCATGKSAIVLNRTILLLHIKLV